MSGYALGQGYSWGRSFQDIEKEAQPAAGASFSMALPSKYTHRLVACVFTLTTDANAANRYVTVESVLGDTSLFCVGAAAVTIPASTSAQRYVGSITRGVAEWATGTDILFPLTPIFLEVGTTLKINVANIQVGDQLSKIRLGFDLFPTNPDYLPGESDS